MQKMLSPRGAAESFSLGTNIRYNPPSSQKMAYDKEDYRHMVQENYGSTNGEQRCGVSGTPYAAAPVPPPVDYSSGNYNDLINSLPKNTGDIANDSLMNALPVATMDSQGAATAGENGAIDDVVNYNRIIISNPNSRTRGQGDPIRGDLWIPPHCTGWFRPSANPTLDLQQGALQVMAGLQSSNSNVSDGIRAMAATGDDYYGGMLMSETDLSQVSAMTDLSVMRLPL